MDWPEEGLGRQGSASWPVGPCLNHPHWLSTHFVLPHRDILFGGWTLTTSHPVTFCCDFVSGSWNCVRSPSAGPQVRLRGHHPEARSGINHGAAAAPTVLHAGVPLSSHVGAEQASSYSFSGDDYRLA